MPEPDPFDARVRAAVHGFADQAQTSVDAAATAAEAIRRGQAGRHTWLGHTVPVPISILIVLVLLVPAVAVSIGVGAAWYQQGRVLPVAVPSPTPSLTPTPSPLPSPLPSPDGEGDEAVAGAEVVTVSTSPAETVVGDVTRQRDGVVATRASMNDFRVDGNGTWQFSADLRSGTGPAWGPYQLETTAGAWEGTCTGSLWADGAGGTRSCWLVGSGDYDGYTYYVSATWSDKRGDVRGVIYPGSPPAP